MRRQNDEFNKTLLQDQANEALISERSAMYFKKLEVKQPIRTSSGREVFSFVSSNLDTTVGDLREAIIIDRFD